MTLLEKARLEKANMTNGKETFGTTWFDVPHILIYGGFIFGLLGIFLPSTLPLWSGACALTFMGVVGAAIKYSVRD